MAQDRNPDAVQNGSRDKLQSSPACIYSGPALILHNDEVTVTEDKTNALLKAAGVNVGPFWRNLFAKALANVNIWSLIFEVGAGGATPAGDPAPPSGAAPAEKKVEAKKEESDESGDDTRFGLLDHTSPVTCSIKS
ncbi:60S acidic ribosomal protein P1-like [Herpailurus yagouaroundi]|uniref:Large ribosomal subunit protein P1 n=1 Tax=Acinonyx jubatus TaxID=32536 RepID=A0ABM3NIE7_ACIJB|nr:60S acidic ribosomal protein P1-like [Puma yagouaroundi]XP_053059206.1 60S acidic ribosomal protein P1-like [Acinonyx jubatus]